MPRSVPFLVISLGLGLLAVGAVPAAGRTQSESWCAEPTSRHLPTEGALARDRDDIQVSYIKRSEIGRAMRRLRRQSVIRLSVRDFGRLARDGGPIRGRYLYLARAGLQTPLHLREAEFLGFAESAGYQITDRGAPDGFKVVSLVFSGFVADRRSYAVLLATPERIPSVTVICLGGT